MSGSTDEIARALADGEEGGYLRGVREERQRLREKVEAWRAEADAESRRPSASERDAMFATGKAVALQAVLALLEPGERT